MSRNIRSGLSIAGLWPFNLERVLGGMSKPPEVRPLRVLSPDVNVHPHSPSSPVRTPTDALSLKALQCRAEAHFKTADDDSGLFFEKFADAAEKSMAARALIDNQIRLLEKQNDEKKVRETARSTRQQ